MQAVGRSCEECGEKIRSALEGDACGACRVAYHHECLEEPDDCPECGVPFGVREKASEDAAAAASWRLVQRGRTIVGAACALIFAVHLGLNFFLLQLARFELEADVVAKVVVRVTLLGGLLWLTFAGRRWARVVLAGLMLIGLAVSGIALGVLGTMGTMVLVGLVALDAAALAAIFLPGASRAFFADREQTAHALRANA